MKRLYRDTINEKIAGVCGGIAKYLNVDPTVVRLLWAFAVIFGGFGIIAYVICAIVIPAEPIGYNYTDYTNRQENGTTYYTPDTDNQ